jgi:hypothetical protein
VIGRSLNYRAYVLRMWEERAQTPEASVWRFSLEDPHTGQVRGFAGLEALVAALGEEMQRAAPTENEQCSAERCSRTESIARGGEK